MSGATRCPACHQLIDTAVYRRHSKQCYHVRSYAERRVIMDRLGFSLDKRGDIIDVPGKW